MKRTSLSLILVFSLMGAPAPVQAANGMVDMMSLMMEMFLWMMSGGGGGFNRYNNIGNFGGIGNPMLAGSLPGYPSGWGSGLPYNTLGMYPSPAYPGLAPYAGSPYTNPYYGQYGSPGNSPYYGNQPYYRQGYNNPFYLNRFNSNSPYARPYRPDPYRRPGEYRNYESRTPSSGQKAPAPVVVQPIIVGPGQQAMKDQPGTAGPDISVEALPPLYPQPATVEPVTPSYAYSEPALDYDNPLIGRWQGINGEYMELRSDRFRLRSNGVEMEGIYQLKNSILKATTPDREEPVYMQYHLDDGHLMFVSEDGQKMLFRRLR